MSVTLAIELPELWMELKDRHMLADLLEEQEKSARHLARIAGYRSHTYIQRLLRGEAKTIDLQPAARIAYDLGVPLSHLFRTRVSGDRARSDQRKDTAA